MKLHTTKAHGSAGFFLSAGALILLGIALICPVVPEDAEAAEGDVPSSAGGNSLSVAISNSKINLTTDPTVNGGMVQSTLDISAKTTNETGYALKISTSSSTAMKSTDSAVSATIPTLSSNATLASFPENRWGYYIGDDVPTTSSSFRPFSTTATEVDTTTAANTALRTKKMTIAAKVGTSLPASTYSAQVVVSVVANLPTPTFGTIHNMQDMTSTVCSSIDIGTDGTLTDTRDGNVYHVGRMLDGKCWMLQNLALGDSTKAIELTSGDSNVGSDWTLSQAFTDPTEGSRDQAGTAVWNLGKWVLATPLLMTDCGTQGSGLVGCIKAGFVDVSDKSRFDPTFTARTMAWEGANSSTNTLVAVNCTAWSGSGESKACTAGSYDAHYLVGNYYQWNAATAGTGGSITNRDASSSICPKGWKLPIRGASNTDGDFYKLTNAYGVSSSLASSNYNIAGSPLSFVRGGYASPGIGVGNAGPAGGYWSSTAGDRDHAYLLSITNSAVDPSARANRFDGRLVRCVAE